MEIKLNVGDKIQIPTGCKVIVKNNFIVIEEEKDEFKDGDILYSEITGFMAIFKNYEDSSKSNFNFYYSNHDRNKNHSLLKTCNFRHATKEEKQSFFDWLKSKDLRWNAETKTMEKIKKRAKMGEMYLYINKKGFVSDIIETYSLVDNSRYWIGNYYLLSEREQAEEDAKAIRLKLFMISNRYRGYEIEI